MTDDPILDPFRAGMSRLDPHKPPHRTITPQRWRIFLADCATFIDGDSEWALLALTLGWEPLEIFGLDRYAPYARIDHQGLVWLVNGDHVEDLDERGCTLITRRSGPVEGNRLTYLRHWMPPNEVVLPWELTP